MILGDYLIPNAYDSTKHQMIGHPITGSFHWDIKLVKIGFGDNWMLSTIPNILTDTGTTLIYFPPGKFDEVIIALDMYNFCLQQIQNMIPIKMKLLKGLYGVSVITNCEDLSVF